MSWFIYILLCDQKTYYIGITNNLSHRLQTHKRRENIGTAEFSEIELVYTEKYLTRKAVEKREKQLKGWTFAKKRALIDGNMILLKQLSKAHGHVEDGSR